MGQERMSVQNTSIDVWQERGELTVTLRDSNGGILRHWDAEEAPEAIEDGFLDARESVLGNLARFARQGGALHKSALWAFASVGAWDGGA